MCSPVTRSPSMPTGSMISAVSVWSLLAGRRRGAWRPQGHLDRRLAGLGRRSIRIEIEIRSGVRYDAAAQLGGPALLRQAAQLGVEIERVFLQFVENVDDAG